MNTRSRTISLASLAGLLVFTGCGHSGGTSAPPRGGATLALQSVIIQPERTPVERMLDGTIEAVNQGTVAAQTAGRVEAVLYDVNDFVAAGAVIVRLRATEKRVGLRAAANAEEEGARAGERAARAVRWPSLEATGGYTRLNASPAWMSLLPGSPFAPGRSSSQTSTSTLQCR